MKKSKQVLGFNLEQLKNWFFYWMVLGVGFVVLIFLITSTWIGLTVKNYCSLAQAKYEGDCVEALSQTVSDDNNSLSERNYAIWSLGQLGDSRAIPVIEKYYTGQIPDREPYNQTLSQYEMKKALKLLRGGTNLTRFIWSN